MKIHLNSVQGLFTVTDYDSTTLWLNTKTRPTFTAPVSEFKSLAGGNWNIDVSQEAIQLFLKTVAPEKVKKSEELDNKIRALARALDKQQAEEQAEQFANSYMSELEESASIIYQDDYDEWLEEMRAEEAKRTPTEWNNMLSDRDSQIMDLKDKLRSIAHAVYSQKLDHTHFQFTKGIKFIIQENHENHTYRMCYDPYGFVSNGHSDISSIYRENDWGTKNGGWLKVINDDVILYYKSGDYGVYDDSVAIECAKELFPTHNIHSFAGRAWDNELDIQFPKLPF